MVQGEQLGKANETAAGNQKRESFTVIPVTPKGLIQGSPYSNTERTKTERKRRRWYQKEKGLGKIQIRESQKEVVDMGRLFAQTYFQLY